MARTVLILTRHDYRTGWRANMHFIADSFRDAGWTTRFLSVGFSALSLIVGDRRADLNGRSNRWEAVNGIDTYLWKTAVHPFGRGLGPLEPVMNRMFDAWVNWPSKTVDEAAAQSDVIVVESGLSAAFVGRMRRAAPNARIVYLASDLNETVNAHPHIDRMLFRDRAAIDAVVVVARAMADHFRGFGRPVHFVPHGVDVAAFATEAPSPYARGRNVVTVGSMLFDPLVFTTAARAFPDVDFHLIGTPPLGETAPNVREHGRMPFEDTIPYLKHADVGVAPYRKDHESGYLSDSSMKLMQYGYLGLPAVCPDFAVGDYRGRFGYGPGDPASIIDAFRRALAPDAAFEPVIPLTWPDVVARLVDPAAFRDTALVRDAA
ncbi:glycosyltransferase [Chthonobacter rhizosphaerae]|uniref:GumK N-terminal domain-containing glycosyltransferase n=1 Tax=Chthonobacter rhizosphaerae TaxID=2735553 RepID=UPI0015EF4525|nr:glycosyltransferase [Chthonobacter rhizosphaerae]